MAERSRGVRSRKAGLREDTGHAPFPKLLEGTPPISWNEYDRNCGRMHGYRDRDMPTNRPSPSTPRRLRENSSAVAGGTVFRRGAFGSRSTTRRIAAAMLSA